MKRKFRIKKRFFVICVLFIFMCMFIKVFIMQGSLMNEKSKALKELEGKIDEEKMVKEKLIEEKKNVYSNEEVERMARDKLGMIRPGEKVLKDIEDND